MLRRRDDGSGTVMESVDLAEAARGLRALLAEAADPDTEFVVSTGTRNRLEGSALTLEALASAK